MIVPFIDILFHSFILWSGQPYNEWMNNNKKRWCSGTQCLICAIWLSIQHSPCVCCVLGQFNLSMHCLEILFFSFVCIYISFRSLLWEQYDTGEQWRARTNCWCTRNRYASQCFPSGSTRSSATTNRNIGHIICSLQKMHIYINDMRSWHEWSIFTRTTVCVVTNTWQTDSTEIYGFVSIAAHRSAPIVGWLFGNIEIIIPCIMRAFYFLFLLIL